MRRTYLSETDLQCTLTISDCGISFTVYFGLFHNDRIMIVTFLWQHKLYVKSYKMPEISIEKSL